MSLATLFTSRRHAQRAALNASWGRAKDQPRNLPAIAAYHEHQVAQGAAAIDARTARDLDLDGVFATLDRTESPLGQQLLLHRLRSDGVSDANRAAFERLVTIASDDVPTRQSLQQSLQTLRHPSTLDLWSLTEPHLLPETAWYAIFPVLALFTIVVSLAIPFWKPAVLLLIASTIASIALRVSIASWLLVVSGPFRQIGAVLSTAQAVASHIPRGQHPTVDALGSDIAALSRLRRIAGLSRRDSGATGDLVGLAMEYLNLVLYLDGNALFFGRRELERHRDALARVLEAVGTVDAAIAVASWRAENACWSRPMFGATDLAVEGMWHPLLATPVPNDVAIAAGSGLIVTGSNMSGKTTYLRALGVTTVMAQTLNTAPAVRYRGPLLHVRTSIGRDDSLAEGKSYYLAEAESVLASVSASEAPGACLFLFDELFRGTNRVERLAAGEAVMRALVADRAHLAIVATHDAELVDQLADHYRPVHFDGQLVDGVLRFDYRMQPGRATSRNAIALLQQLGAPAAIIDAATTRATALDAASKDAP